MRGGEDEIGAVVVCPGAEGAQAGQGREVVGPAEGPADPTGDLGLCGEQQGPVGHRLGGGHSKDDGRHGEVYRVSLAEAVFAASDRSERATLL